MSHSSQLAITLYANVCCLIQVLRNQKRMAVPTALILFIFQRFNGEAVMWNLPTLPEEPLTITAQPEECNFFSVTKTLSNLAELKLNI